MKSEKKYHMTSLYMESKNKIQISLQKRLTDVENKSTIAGGEGIIMDFATLLNIMCQNE